jgi:ABC-type multidrug transport system fused ATPase/permease subunit
MGILDLLGVALIGLLGALSVSGVGSGIPGDRVTSALRFLHLENVSFETQVSLIGASAVILLVGRTILSVLFTRKILFFFSHRGAKISADMISRLLSQQLLFVQSRTIQETLFAITSGVSVITLYIMATTVVLISDISMLVIMGVGLMILDPVIAIGTLSIFALVGFLLFRLMHVRVGKLGVENSILNIQSNEKIVEVFLSYRESVVSNRRDYYARQIRKKRFEIADNMAEINFMPYVSKYVIETSVVLGALLIGFVQFFLQDATNAVATLAVFLAAGSRIAPALLRVQQALLTIRGSLGQAQPTLKLIDELGDEPVLQHPVGVLEIDHKDFKPTICVSNASLMFPGNPIPAITEVSFEIPSGSSVAIVGPSGAGKTTIIDIVLGVLNPDTGSVLISGLPPLLAIARWPGAIAYVPQDVFVAAGSIRDNVALGYPTEEATDDLVMKALKIANLDGFVGDLPSGLETQVGEHGTRLSGGQRQRLGIARAMFTNPKLLVLDEATSALDSESEASVSESIHALRGSTTVVLIAHRLSTVRNSDLVIYLSEGRVEAKGTFEEVRIAVPDFDLQARLLGL